MSLEWSEEVILLSIHNGSDDVKMRQIYRRSAGEWCELVYLWCQPYHLTIIVSFFSRIYVLLIQLSACQLVSLSACQHVSMSACQHVSMSACQHVSILAYGLNFWNHLLSTNQHANMSTCQHVNMSICQHFSMSACQPVKMSICQYVSMSACQYVSMSAC